MNRAEIARIYTAVGCGAAVGALLRYLSGVAIVSMGLPSFATTAFVNVVGSFVIGFFATLTAPDGRLLVSPARRQFVMAGICGGFTTFSSMTLDTLMLDYGPGLGAAALYLGAVVAASLLATLIGYLAAARVNR